MDQTRTIIVTANPDPDPLRARFEMAENGVGIPELEFDKSKNGMKKSDRYIVHFQLVDNSGLGLRFVRSKANAMWVHQVSSPTSTACPPAGSQVAGFDTICVHDDCLTVLNRDEKKQYLSFCLNFIRANGNDQNSGEYVAYDPISNNKNGGTPFMSTTDVAVGFAVGAVAVLGGAAALGLLG